ncbi:sigma-70 family RNA polymerase sigma factor [Sedimentibacter sp.]|uniref:sigma-70 family RNA polymerase sigma factor n=1 Tax=Sedimentibacter sp. TaxID=1960295 RepID=UPI0028AE1ABD|nr:sigma-70 family RNA polymerase sigma factor [Sedimentibacter sp.]
MLKKEIDKENYISFITQNKEMLYRVAYGYLRDEIKSLDAVDEAVYQGYVHIYDLREHKYLKTWVTRILINECLKIIRNGKRELNTEILPEKSYISDEDSMYLRYAVNNLPEDLRKIVVLRYFGGYTISETAEILEIPEGTVSTRTRKALEILKVEISE